ncbi:MAG: hypothetical protein J0M04_06650 [Verrucomicrobia bacterium]|nr:hypothetical protein [Verrucomicrobiota bacterium]
MQAATLTIGLGLLAAMSPLVQATPAIATFKTRSGTFEIGNHGELLAIKDAATGRNYLAENQAAPVLQVRVAGKDLPPETATWDGAAGNLSLTYSGGLKAVVRIAAKPTHVVLELIETDTAKVDLVRWGPYPTTINRVIGEMVGVVRDGEFAVGIQALNAKTQGGEPCGDDFQEHRYQVPDAVPHDGILHVSDRPRQHFCAVATAAPFGSTLQLHAWEHERGDAFFTQTKRLPYAPDIAMKYPGETVVGTRIALFACPEPEALDTLGAIELAENLPHPTVDGVWIKKDPRRGPAPHLCFEFDEKNLDEFIAIAKACEIDWIYHNSPWASWGHFPLKPAMFPRGMESFKDCVDRIHKAGLHLGVHTLSTFITADDPYVTVPYGHPNLARIGGPCSKTGHVVISYGKQVYFSDRTLSAEIARTCARIVNEGKLDQFEFDGVESNWTAGMGGYGRDLFYDAFHAALAPERKNKVMLGGSNLDNYGWHSYCAANWGEPWYDTFRNRMIDYRIDMVHLHARNYLPKMLGQFFIHPEGEKPEDIAWLMALSTGYDAGFSLTFGRGGNSYMSGEPTSETARLRPANLTELTTIIRTWRQAAKVGVFTDDLKRQLQDKDREFHLEAAGRDAWNLYALHTIAATIGKDKPAPGVRNPHAKSALWLDLANTGKEPVRGITCSLNGKTVQLCDELKPGERFRFNGGAEAKIHDATWKILRSSASALGGASLNQGDVPLDIFWADKDKFAASLQLELRLPGAAIPLRGH